MSHDAFKPAPAKFRRAYHQHGYVCAGRHGEFVAAEEPLRDSLLNLLLEQGRGGPDDGLSRADLVEMLFPRLDQLSGLGEVDLDRLKVDLSNMLWGLTQTAPTGHIQRRLGDQPEAPVLCRADVQRGERRVQVCYVTTDQDLIMRDQVMPALGNLLSHFDTLRDDYELLVGRQPDLQPVAAAMLRQGMREVYEKLSMPLPDELAQTEHERRVLAEADAR